MAYNGPMHNYEAMGMSYNEWLKYQNNMNRMRRNATLKRKNLSKNVLGVQMLLKGRGPSKPPVAPLQTRKRTEQNVIDEVMMKHMWNIQTEETRAETVKELKAALKAFHTSKEPESSLGGAGGPSKNTENTSSFTVLPEPLRNKIASYLSGVERNHLKPIKSKIAFETAKLRKRKHRTSKGE